MLGPCWLYCGRLETEVHWLGPVTIEAATAPMYACTRCTDRLTRIAVQSASAREVKPAAVGDRSGTPSTAEVSLPRRALAGIARQNRPHTPLPDDGNPWTLGWCWLYCVRGDLHVLPIGTVTADRLTATVHACANCIARLNNLLWESIVWADTGIGPVGAELSERGASAPAAPECERGRGSGFFHRAADRERPHRARLPLLSGPVGAGLARFRRRRGHPA
ncbi:hypothetical protein [Kitasatospora phosalacinea]|uniref:hypothetical protein n=1 Tax=Kitasatospora phosalacinea TaxID=2065 RepID=UPI000AE97242|nr:hypothetical protein [Kitasatospora phosalacinea]